MCGPEIGNAGPSERTGTASARTFPRKVLSHGFSLLLFYQFNSSGARHKHKIIVSIGLVSVLSVKFAEHVIEFIECSGASVSGRMFVLLVLARLTPSARSTASPVRFS